MELKPSNGARIDPIERSLQDFTVLRMEIFRRYVIQRSSVIFLPTTSSTENIRQLSFRR